MSSITKGYQGKYIVRHPEKYVGDLTNVTYRSLWERQFCKWCDASPKVYNWAIEPVEIPYFDVASRKYRKYRPDFYLQMDDGRKYLIEIKPRFETVDPRVRTKGHQRRRSSKKFQLMEQTYLTNVSKWEAAEEYCKSTGYKFKIMTEHDLKALGIKLVERKKVPRISKKKKVKKKYVSPNRIKKPTAGFAKDENRKYIRPLQGKVNNE